MGWFIDVWQEVIIPQFKEEMQDVFKDPYERNALEYFNFYAWLDSKIHTISFSDAIKIRKQSLA